MFVIDEYSLLPIMSHPYANKSTPDGHLQVANGTKLNRSTKILVQIGSGTFGRVYKCYYRRVPAAIKIIKNIRKYIDAAQHEIRILNHISGRAGCIEMIDTFTYNTHPCLLFPLLSISVYDFLKTNNFRPFPIEQIRHFAQQIGQALAFLHSENIIHTDLKPGKTIGWEVNIANK